MVITNLEQKQNRKIWVPIRGGNRGGWSLFDWQKVREIPYRDRQMYLGNSAKIGVLDKGGKWRKKDWYLKRNHLEGEELQEMRGEAMRKDQERMNTALGLTAEEEEEKLTPAQMQILLKRIKGGKEDGPVIESNAIGLGFDKTKVEIRAKPTVKTDNPHRLEGIDDDDRVKIEARDSDDQRSHTKKKEKKEKKEKKDKKEKKEKRHRERSQSERSRSRDNHKYKDRHREQRQERSRQERKQKRYRDHSD